MPPRVRGSHRRDDEITRAGGIIAAGAGTRLRDATFGKALQRVNGLSLIEGVLEQFANAELSDVFVVVRSDDFHLRCYLQCIERRGHFRVIRTCPVDPGAGTGHAVRTASIAIGDQPHLISTVDLVAPAHVARDLCRESEEFDQSVLSVLATTTYMQDESPVWVSCIDGVVSEFGKDSVPSGEVFGNIRWVSGRATRELMRRRLFWRATRDTEIVRMLIDHAPGAVRARRFGIIFDVDRDIDVVAASQWVRDSCGESDVPIVSSEWPTMIESGFDWSDERCRTTD